jgi:hypothetical protein
MGDMQGDHASVKKKVTYGCDNVRTTERRVCRFKIFYFLPAHLEQKMTSLRDIFKTRRGIVVDENLSTISNAAKMYNNSRKVK